MISLNKTIGQRNAKVEMNKGMIVARPVRKQSAMVIIKQGTSLSINILSRILNKKLIVDGTRKVKIYFKWVRKLLKGRRYLFEFPYHEAKLIILLITS